MYQLSRDGRDASAALIWRIDLYARQRLNAAWPKESIAEGAFDGAYDRHTDWPR